MADHKMHPDLVRRRLLRPLAVLVAVLVTSVAVIGGCSDDEPESDQPAANEPDESTGSGSPTEAARPITTKTTVGRVIGKLGAKQKERLKSDVSALVDEFFDNAYLGDFPRSSFGKAYASFTEGARADAERDADLLSNTEIADRIDAATGTKRRVAVDVMAVKGKPQGVTARFTLDFRTTGELERTERVKGYLLLADEGDGWRVFGYDVIRSVVA